MDWLGWANPGFCAEFRRAKLQHVKTLVGRNNWKKSIILGCFHVFFALAPSKREKHSVFSSKAPEKSWLHPHPTSPAVFDSKTWEAFKFAFFFGNPYCLCIYKWIRSQLLTIDPNFMWHLGTFIFVRHFSHRNQSNVTAKKPMGGRGILQRSRASRSSQWKHMPWQIGLIITNDMATSSPSRGTGSKT